MHASKKQVSENIGINFKKWGREDVKKIQYEDIGHSNQSSRNANDA